MLSFPAGLGLFNLFLVLSFTHLRFDFYFICFCHNLPQILPELKQKRNKLFISIFIPPGRRLAGRNYSTRKLNLITA